MSVLSRTKLKRKQPSPISAVTIATQIGGLTWHCLTAYRSQFLKKEMIDFANLEIEPKAILVKKNPMRQVYRICDNDMDIYIKLYHNETLQQMVKQAIAGNPAKMEFNDLYLAHSRNIDVPKPIAWVEGKAFNLLVTESIGESQSLEDILWQHPPVDKEFLYETLMATARTIAKMHCNGLDHTDLHSGNILVTSTPNGLKCTITDLYNVNFEQRSGHASAHPLHPRRMANIASLFAGMRYHLQQDPLRLFIKTYLESLNLLEHFSQEDFDTYYTLVNHKADLHSRKIWKGKDRRATRNSKYAKKIKLNDNWSANVFLQCKHPDPESKASKKIYQTQEWKNLLNHPLTLLEGGESLKEGGHSTIIAKTLCFEDLDLEVVVKHIRLKSGWRGFLQSCRASKAFRQWLRGHALIHRRIDTAWPLASVEHRKGFFLQESILITERIKGAYNLHVALRDNHLPDSHIIYNDLATQLGLILADFRKKGCRFRDAKAQNFLVSQRPDQSWRLHIIDLDGFHIDQTINSLTKHEALIRLAVSIMRHPKIGPRYYVRAFTAYIRLLALPQAYDRPSRHQLWHEVSQHVLKSCQTKEIIEST